MKAIIWKRYGSPESLEMRDMSKPVPKVDEVLIKIHAAIVTAGDCELRRFDLPKWIWLPVRLYMGLLRPRINVLGQEFSGEIEEVGNQVTRFNVGDQVCVCPGMKMGGYAEYSCVSEKRILVKKPERVSYAEVATIPTGGINGLHFVRKAGVRQGDHVLINGAGGSIGTYALQLAKNLGAQVTCVDSASKLEMLKRIGADRVIDFQKEDFTKSQIQYEVIIDVAGKSSFKGCFKSLKPGGRMMLGNPQLSGMLRAKFTSMISNIKVFFALAKENLEDVQYLMRLIDETKIKVVIGQVFSLREVPAAHRCVEEGSKQGNLIVHVVCN